LTLAILLYQHEHGKLPDENWTEQIAKYLGDNPTQYFSCPTNPSPNGETTYRLVQYGDELPTDPNTLLLIELDTPVPLRQAIISADEVIELTPGEMTIVERECCGRVTRHEQIANKINAHPGGMNVAHRSGAVLLLLRTVKEDELLRLLGREVEIQNRNVNLIEEK
jgi:hypothetical protein